MPIMTIIFLSNAIEECKKPFINEVIVGSSYSMYGMDEKKLNAGVINLSLPSQDIYYSILKAKEVINSNKNIKRCYMGTGYWTFNIDLSKSIKSKAARIEKVYYPIFGDSNHYN
ncbi:hypothetical protein [Paenibacillus sp. OK003]|uniref:hypothetical protein n=1 Tax=Paenibacillus sp. OK003 TaxID=1884380 RepID=UPI0008D36D68|nr:hypothetical protein [Paenibacillus sp. OK003]SEL74861.1 hypothetical protein SAMN05518856_11752 [Paenibacillus sp. OK003]